MLTGKNYYDFGVKHLKKVIKMAYEIQSGITWRSYSMEEAMEHLMTSKRFFELSKKHGHSIPPNLLPLMDKLILDLKNPVIEEIEECTNISYH